MRGNKDSTQYLVDMLDHARAAVGFAAPYTQDTYFNDQLRRFALLHVKRDLMAPLPDPLPDGERENIVSPLPRAGEG
jgi:hypothetical protein